MKGELTVRDSDGGVRSIEKLRQIEWDADYSSIGGQKYLAGLMVTLHDLNQWATRMGDVYTVVEEQMIEVFVDLNDANGAVLKKNYYKGFVGYGDVMPVPPVADTALPWPQAAPVLVESASSEPAGVTIHSTKTRRNTLTPVIEAAQKDCSNSEDTAEVWAVLQTMAEKKVPPLLGATEDGLQYLRAGVAATFSREALRKRLARKSPLTAVKRR
jgi:hypothetical protein